MTKRSKTSYQEAISELKERRSRLLQSDDARVADVREVEAQIAALRAEQLAAYPELLEPVKD